MSAQPLRKQQEDSTLLSRALRDEKQMTTILKMRLAAAEQKLAATEKARAEAENQTRKFHALLLQERIRKL